LSYIGTPLRALVLGSFRRLCQQPEARSACWPECSGTAWGSAFARSAGRGPCKRKSQRR
jgi:hypothetical protein